MFDKKSDLNMSNNLFQLYYQDYTKATPKILTIPGCSSFCKLDQLYEIVQENLPGENDVCGTSDEVF
jgi:prostatic aicd phosphatase